MSDPTETELEALAQKLSAHADYRVVRRYRKPDYYTLPSPDQDDLKTGIFLDVETTGLDYQGDHIIELAMVKFEFASSGVLYRIRDEFDELNDPGVPIPEEITKITGITDEMVAGHVIKPAEVLRFIEDAAIIIAHNAAFDRKFVESSLTGFEDKAWACSARQVPWREAGFESAKLEYLAYRQGFFYDGHRASADCLAGIHVLSAHLDCVDKTAFAMLLENARQKDFRVWAVNSPFETKDILKARGYRWNNGDDGRPKSWFRDVSGDELDGEQQFLADKIYGTRRTLPVDMINAFNRYSARI